MEHYNISLENIDGEIWKDVAGYEGKYQISNFCRVKSLSRGLYKKERILKQMIGKTGYFVVALYCNSKGVTMYVHRLFALSFIDNPDNKPCINHKNGIKTDNNIENIEWATRQENNMHAVSTGLNPKKGELHPLSVFTNSEVADIKRLLKSGMRNIDVARKYNINRGSVANIKSGRIWGHIIV